MALPDNYGLVRVDNLEFANGGTIFSTFTATADGLVTLSSASGLVELTGVKDPTMSASAATKAYVDGLIEGIVWKVAVVVATDAEELAFTTAFASGQTINGVVLSLGDRILIKDQDTTPVQNGIYIVTAGTPTRAPDMDVGSSAHGDAVYATGGIVCGGCAFICVSPVGADIVGTNAITFTVFSSPSDYTDGVGIDITGLVISVDNTVVRTVGPYTMTGVLTHNVNVDFIPTAAATFATNKLTVQHTDTNAEITNTTGNLTLSNTSATGAILAKTGTNTNATKFAVQNSFSADMFTVDGASNINCLVPVTATNNVTVYGDFMNTTTKTEINSATGVTYLVTQINNTIIRRTSSDNSVSDVTPTAEAIITNMASAQLSGTAYSFSLANVNAAACVITLTATDPNVTLDGIMTVVEDEIRQFRVVKTSGTTVTIYSLSSNGIGAGGAGGVDTQLQFNSGGTSFGGVEQWTTNGTTDLTASDTGVLNFGTGLDCTMQFDGTNMNILNTAGDLVLRNLNGTGSTVIQTGTSSATTSFEVKDSIGTTHFEIDGTGQAVFARNVDVGLGVDITSTSPLRLGPAAELILQHTTNGRLTNTSGALTVESSGGGDLTFQNLDVATGDVRITNNNVTGQIYVDLSSITNSTAFFISNATEPILQVFGDGGISNHMTTSDGSTFFLLEDGTYNPILKVLSNGITTIGNTTTIKGKETSFTGVVTVDSVGVATYTAASMNNGIILRDPSGSDQLDTTATAVDIVASIPDAAINSSYEFSVFNTADGSANTVTVQPGVGVTMEGSDILAAGENRTFRVILTNVTGGAEAVTIYSVGSNGVGAAGVPGGADTQIQFNSGGTDFGGVSGWTTNGSTNLTGETNAELQLGPLGQLALKYDGTFTRMTSTEGNMIIQNTVAGTGIFMQLGSNTVSERFMVVDDALGGLFIVHANGLVSAGGNVEVAGATSLQNLDIKTTTSTVTDGGVVVYTSAQFFNGLILRNPTGGDTIDVTPSAADIVAGMPLAKDNSSYDFTIINNGSSDTVTLSAGAGVTLVGDMVMISGESRIFRLVVTSTVAASEAVTIYSISTNGVGAEAPPGGSDTQIQFNSGGTAFGGIGGWTTNGSSTLTGDNTAVLNLGTGNLSLAHAGTNSVMTSVTGNLILDNTNATGTTVMQLGDDTVDTSFQVQNDSATALLTVAGSGAVTSAGITTVSDTTQSTVSTDGALIVGGGVGIAKDVYCAGTVNAVALLGTSDKRKKKNIVNVDDTTETIEKLRVVEYSWKEGTNTKRKVIGVIAQEVEELVPEAVYRSEADEYSVDHNHLLHMMMKSYQTSLKRISMLEQRLEALEK